MQTEPDSEFEQAREQFRRKVIHAVSHDLKTPLACVIGSLEICEYSKATISEEQKNSLINNALSEARKLDAQITNMLELAKLDKPS